jgi:hypothetical protein
MDGRHFQRLFSGFFLAGALGCHSGSKYPQNMLPQGGQPAANAVPPSSGGIFGAKSPPPGMPLESLVPTPHKKGPLSPEFEVAIAETRLQVALAEPPPPNRDELIDSVRAGFQRALKQNPKHKEALIGVARMYARIDDKEHAIEAYDKYLKHYPKDAEVWNEMAKRRAQWKDMAGAVAACEIAVKHQPDNRTYRKSLGFYQAMMGKWDDALASLCKVMPEAQARHNLAGMLDQAGQPEACRQQLELAVKADPNYAPAREFLSDLSQGSGVQQAGFTQP